MVVYNLIKIFNVQIVTLVQDLYLKTENVLFQDVNMLENKAAAFVKMEKF